MMCKCGVCVYFHRQLEAIIRISEALAKMSLSPFALDTHVDEALRLFQVSTLEAAHSGRLAGKWPWRCGQCGVVGVVWSVWSVRCGQCGVVSVVWSVVWSVRCGQCGVVSVVWSVRCGQ